MTTKPSDKSIESNPQQPPLVTKSPRSSRDWLNLFLKTGSAIGLGLFLLGIIGVGVGRWWAKNNLALIVAQELTKTLKRPVSLGEIENIWFDEVHLTNASIPANGKDLNRLAVRDIIVKFDPIKLAFDRTLKLDVRLVAPSIYLAQNIKGNWVDIPAQEKTPPSPIKVEVGTVNIENARVIVVPFSKNPQPVTISKINLQAEVDQSQQRATFNSGAQFEQHGQVQIQGNTLIANGKTELVVKGQKLDAAAATRVVKIPEVSCAVL